MTVAWLVVFAVGLVVLAFCFAMVEAALSRVSRVNVEESLRDGRAGARALHEIELDAARFLNVLTFLRISSELVSAALVTYALLRVLGSGLGSVLVAAAVMIVISYVVVGVSPRTLGRQHAETVALYAAPAVRRIALLLSPLTNLLILLGNALTPGKGFAEGPFASEAELRDLVDLAEENALIESDERQMIHGVFELGDTVVREIMVPRNDMIWIERGKTLRQALSLHLRSGFSRIPVVGEGGLDDVIGTLYLKDLVRRTHDYHESESTEKVDSVLRPAAFIPESKPVDALLREMQADRTHLAVVVDEYGGVAGLVTIEDILEEIVGDITDEYDRGAPEVQRLDGGRLRVSARLNLGDLSEIIDIDLEDEDVDTVSGLLAKHLGRVPIPGAHIEVAGVALTAEAALGRRNRVGSVLVEMLGEPPLESAGSVTDRGEETRRVTGTADRDGQTQTDQKQEQVQA